MMKQKLFTIGDRFTVKDEKQHVAYYVDGQIFTIGDKLSFKNSFGEELFFIQQKVFSLITTYTIFREDSVYAIIRKEPFTFFRSRFTIEAYNGDLIQIQGNFIDHEYRFYKGDTTIASVSKEFFSWSDTYGIDILDGEDDELILACAVIIDMISHNKN